MATQEERKTETRARLLAAAADLFAHKGFHAVSTEAVAEAADRTTGAVYAHFGGKDGLLLALLEEWRSKTVNEIEAELDVTPHVDDRLLALWARFIAHGDEPAGADRADAMTLLEHELWLYAARQPEVADTLGARYDDDRADLGRGLTHFAQAEGAQLTLAIDQQSVLALGLLLGLAMQHRLDPTAVPPELVVIGLRRVLGLSPSPASR